MENLIKIMIKGEAEIDKTYGNVGYDWQVYYENEDGSFGGWVDCGEEGTTPDGNRVWIYYQVVNPDAEWLEDTCDWDIFWVLDEDLNIIGTQDNCKLVFA